MPTPASILLGASTLDTGTPWDHLNNLEACTGLILTNGLEVEMEDSCVDLLIDLSGVDVMIDDDIEVDVETLEFVIEVC